MVEIETQRPLLRGRRDEDLDAYARVCADPEVMRYIGGATLTREESEAQGFGLWAAEERASGALIGFVGHAYQEDWTGDPNKTEVGWRLDRSFWGRGIANEGAAAALRYGFDELGLSRIISIIQPANLASRRVAEKAGLTPRGETRWRSSDVVWYAIDRPTGPGSNLKPDA